MQISTQPVTPQTTNYFDLSDEEIARLAQEATRAAVIDLHQHGISTYGEIDGVMYETKPNGETIKVDRDI